MLDWTDRGVFSLCITTSPATQWCFLLLEWGELCFSPHRGRVAGMQELTDTVTLRLCLLPSHGESEKALALGIVPGSEPSVMQPSLAAVVQPSLVAYYIYLIHEACHSIEWWMRARGPPDRQSALDCAVDCA
eukprot:1118023-Rhodomonas_salina.4